LSHVGDTPPLILLGGDFPRGGNFGPFLNFSLVL
jgi:hypothetical protein